MLVRTEELTSDALDWAVARCEGLDLEHGLTDDERYSTNWAQGGPILDREGVCLLDPASNQNRNGQWHANCGAWGADGATPLIAAMRCFVASKLGDEVEVPEELLA